MAESDHRAPHGCSCGSTVYGFPLGVQFRPHWEWPDDKAALQEDSEVVMVDVQCLMCDRIFPVPISKERLYAS